MKFCYVDESGVPAVDDWFFLGAFVIDVDDANRLEEMIFEAMDLDWQEEIMMDTLKDLRAGDTFEVARRNELSDQIYEYFDSNVDYTVFTIIFNQDAIDKDDEVEIYVLAFKYLLERLQWFLDRNDELGIVYNDSHAIASDIQEAHHRLQRTGTEYLDFENIVGVSAPLSDELSRGIQMADLVTAGVRAYFLDIETRYFTDYLLPHVDRNPRDGSIMGTGIKVFPDGAEDELSNLHSEASN